MTKANLIDIVAEKNEITKKDATRIVNSTLDTITAALVAGDRVQLADFGIFETKERAARPGRNPKTNEVIEIAASTSVSFKASKTLKDAVAK